MALRKMLAASAKFASRRLLAAAPQAFFIVAACCRWPADETRAAAIRSAAAGEVDWDQVVRLAARHRVTGFVSQGLEAAGIAPSAAAVAALAAGTAALSRTNSLQALETARLSQLLQQAGVAAVFVKGATLHSLAYSGLPLKQSFDIDILVAPDEVGAARQVLEVAGYRLRSLPPFLTQTQSDLLIAVCREWQFQRGSTIAELQWRLTYNRQILQNAGVGSPLQAVKAGGAMVPTFCSADLFVYLCVHGAQHSWSRLKWLADLNALLALDGMDIERLYERAAKAGAGRCAAQALLLRERLFGAALPEPLRTRLHAAAMPLLLEAVALDAVLGKTTLGGRPFRLWRDAASLLLLGEGKRFFAEEFRRYLIAPADVAAIALPKGLTWLYAVLRGPLLVWRHLLRRS